MALYTVTMSLYCESTDPHVLKAFDLIWTASRQAAWTMMAATAASDAALAGVLNDEIYNAFQKQIGDDLQMTAGAQFNGVLAFAAGSWVPGGGGLHEGKVPTITASKAGAPVAQWKFKYTPSGGGTATQAMCVQCSWKLAKTIP